MRRAPASAKIKRPCWQAARGSLVHLPGTTVAQPGGFPVRLGPAWGLSSERMMSKSRYASTFVNAHAMTVSRASLLVQSAQAACGKESGILYDEFTFCWSFNHGCEENIAAAIDGNPVPRKAGRSLNPATAVPVACAYTQEKPRARQGAFLARQAPAAR